MPKRLTVNGTPYLFPDDATPEELNKFLASLDVKEPAPPAIDPWDKVGQLMSTPYGSEKSQQLLATPDGEKQRTLGGQLYAGAVEPFKPENLPATGGMLGGGIGSYGGPAGSVLGATLGGAIGAGVRDGVYTYQGDKRAPDSFPEALENAAWDGTMQGGMQAIGTAVSPALKWVGETLENRAVPFVRSALKFSKPDIERRALIEGRSFDEVANRQSQHIVDNRLTSEAKAQARVDNLGGQIDEKVAAFESANPGVGVDFNTRAPKYLSDFLTKIENNQLLPDQDIAAVQAVGPRIMNSPLTRSTAATSSSPRPVEETLQEVLEAARNINQHAPDVDLPAGQWTGPGMPFAQPAGNRVLREDISPSEMLRRVRGKSFYDPNVQEGTIMGGKVLERAGRDSVKEAVPEVAPLLEDQGLSLDAVKALRNYGIREGNADQLRQGALHSLANRNLPAAVILQLVKSGQLKAGVAAGVRGPQIKRAADSWLADPNVVSNALRLMFSQNGGQQ